MIRSRVVVGFMPINKTYFPGRFQHRQRKNKVRDSSDACNDQMVLQHYPTMSHVILLCILALISGAAYIEIYLVKVFGFRVPIISNLPRWAREGIQANFGLIFLVG